MTAQHGDAWSVDTRELNPGVLQYRLLSGGEPVSVGQTIALWESDARFRAFFAQTLADAPLGAFRWETPPVASDSLDRDFEFVLVACESLQRSPDVGAFADRFQSGEGVVEFSNLSGDASLVVPCPEGDHRCYAHLASFLRGAPSEQVDRLWQVVGEAMRKRVGSSPVWLSTAGMGVAWLHVRLDSRPKYYAHKPYRSLAKPSKRWWC